MNKNITIRPAIDGEEEIILQFIQALAKYENLESEVVATKELFRENIFVKKCAEVVIAEYTDENKKVHNAGFALFFHNFSTFLGKPGLYLEDLFVHPEFRGKGIGVALFRHLINLTKERGCGRMEWSCLDWNESSINFYKSFGAVAMDEWSVYRLSEEKLRDL